MQLQHSAVAAATYAAEVFVARLCLTPLACLDGPRPGPRLESCKSYSAALEGRAVLLRARFQRNTIGQSAGGGGDPRIRRYYVHHHEYDGPA